jgi:altered-inheritance-of-mitochondria protein 5
MAETAPPSAADRIAQRPFTTMLKSSWNQQVESVFKHVGDWDQHALDWGRKLFYGSDKRE